MGRPVKVNQDILEHLALLEEEWRGFNNNQRTAARQAFRDRRSSYTPLARLDHDVLERFGISEEEWRSLTHKQRFSTRKAAKEGRMSYTFDKRARNKTPKTQSVEDIGYTPEEWEGLTGT